MILSSGYATGYSADRVRRRAEFAAKAITSLSRRTGATSVVVHGNSGVSCGFATLSQQSGVPNDAAPECVGIVLYGHHSSDSFKFSDGHIVPALGRG